MNNLAEITPKRSTAQRHIVAVLSQEILAREEAKPFLLASEFQLCKRFKTSRVTIRLALQKLENRGLIYRVHGKGTFAYGRSTRIQRDIAILIKVPMLRENRPLTEILRGVQTFVHSHLSAVTLISHSEKWRSEQTSLTGVIVVAEHVTANDLANLNNRKLPFLILGKTDLPGPRIRFNAEDPSLDDGATFSMKDNFFEAGQRAAEALTKAFLTEEPVRDIIISAQRPAFPANVDFRESHQLITASADI